MKGKGLWWKIPVIAIGVVLGLAVVLTALVAGVIATPSARTAVLQKGLGIASAETGMDLQLGRLYLSPFHHSPMLLYRAWKGENDLPLAVEIDSLFVGHRGQDTLLCVHTLRLHADVKTTQFSGDLLAVPIVVDTLHLEHVTLHSDTLIASVGLDILVGRLSTSSPEISIAEGRYPLHGFRLDDAFVEVGLRDTPDTTAKDSTPLLLAFDLPDGRLRNIHFDMQPLGLMIETRSLNTNALVDVGANRYTARRIDIGGIAFGIAAFHMPVDTLYGEADVSLETNLITSSGLHVRADSLGAKLDLAATMMDLSTMRIRVTGDAEMQGSRASLRGYYDIDDEAYDVSVDLDSLNLSPFLDGCPPLLLSGSVKAQGQGINPRSRAMKSEVQLHMTECVIDTIDISGIQLHASLANQAVEGNLHLPVRIGGQSPIRAQTEHRFRVADFMTPERMQVDYRAQVRGARARLAGENLAIDSLGLHFATDSLTAFHLATRGLRVEAASPLPLMRLVDGLQPFASALGDSATIQDLVQLTDLTKIDTIRHLLPPLSLEVALTPGSPLQPFIRRTGLEIKKVRAAVASDAEATELTLTAALPDIGNPDDSTALRLPAAQASVEVALTEGRTTVSMEADTRITDGLMQVHGLRTDLAVYLDLERQERRLYGTGCVVLDSLVFSTVNLGNRSVDIALSPSSRYPNAVQAAVRLDDVPLDLVDSIIRFPDLDLKGAIRAQAVVDGLPAHPDISAEVLPIGVSAEYKPFEIALGLGETPITMEHNRLHLNHFPIYSMDSSYIALTGGLDLDTMQLDVAIDADRFSPVKMLQSGEMLVYGELATDIHGRVKGALDSLKADVAVTILPVTDITCHIDKKNLAQVKPYGTVSVSYDMAASSLGLGGEVHIDEGFIRYSPKVYPIMPFHVDSGSHITFNGPVGQTYLDVSASQKVKADVQSRDEETRRVNFTTGVRVRGVVDSIGLRTVGFFLEAPEDETITHELASLDEDTREGIAAALLATGMYLGESNVGAQRSDYALSSIINSRINAAMANSKMGKVVDIDLSTGMTQHASGETNDMNIAVSKAFFKDRLRISLGASISDNPEVMAANGLLNNITAEYRLTKDGTVGLRLFAQRDYNNILEGELIKSGLGVRATKQWSRLEPLKRRFPTDSVTRTYGLTADADIAYRNNNSIGPNLTLTTSARNLLGQGETFSIKGNGAYYWALRNRHPGDPKKTDTYKFGINTSLVFPYLHWVGTGHPEGDTRYMIGYQYENIAGGYGVHKVSGSFTYFIRSTNCITHAFTPFSMSFVYMKAESADLLDKASDYPQLIKLLAGDELVPAIAYHFTYNDYRLKRGVNTMLDLGIKEAGNIINGIYCLFGYKWNQYDKPLGKKTFNQFVKLSAELRNKFNLTDRVCFATRLFAGTNIPLGNSSVTPLSEAFYAGGTNSMRASSPYSYGPGNFYSAKYNQSFFHTGDVKLEANFEVRFPIVWKLFGAVFVDAGNVWNWYNTKDAIKRAGYEEYISKLELQDALYDGIIGNKHWADEIALGTGTGLRLDLDGLVIRLDIGVAIHAPYQTYKRNKKWEYDYSQPITTYFNLPSALDAVRVNFGIGYPF